GRTKGRQERNEEGRLGRRHSRTGAGFITLATELLPGGDDPEPSPEGVTSRKRGTSNGGNFDANPRLGGGGGRRGAGCRRLLAGGGRGRYGPGEEYPFGQVGVSGFDQGTGRRPREKEPRGRGEQAGRRQLGVGRGGSGFAAGNAAGETGRPRHVLLQAPGGPKRVAAFGWGGFQVLHPEIRQRRAGRQNRSGNVRRRRETPARGRR